MEDALATPLKLKVGNHSRDAFLEAWQSIAQADSYIEAIQSLDAETKQHGSQWLQAIVDNTVSIW